MAPPEFAGAHAGWHLCGSSLAFTPNESWPYGRAPRATFALASASQTHFLVRESLLNFVSSCENSVCHAAPDPRRQYGLLAGGVSEPRRPESGGDQPISRAFAGHSHKRGTAPPPRPRPGPWGSWGIHPMDFRSIMGKTAGADVAQRSTTGRDAPRTARFALAKFRPTTLPATLLTRPALLGRLEAGASQRLTVVVGSAGPARACCCLAGRTREMAG